MNHKKIGALVLIAGVPLLLSGCGQHSEQQITRMIPGGNGNGKQSQQAQTSALMAQGKPYRVGEFITVPVVFQNNGQSALGFDSSNIHLRLAHTKEVPVKKLFRTVTQKKIVHQNLSMYSPADETSAQFNLDMDSNDQFQTFLTFKLSHKQAETYTDKEIAQGQLVFTMPNGKQLKASAISSNMSADNLKTSLASDAPITISEYYNNIEQVIDQYMQTKNQGNSSSSTDGDSQVSGTALRSDPQFIQEVKSLDYGPTYLDLHIGIDYADKHHIMITVDNETSQAMTLPLSSLQLAADNSNDTMMAPEYNNYALFLPAKKMTYAIIPTSKAISSKSFYMPKIKVGKSNKFKSTVNMPYPILYGAGKLQGKGD